MRPASTFEKSRMSLMMTSRLSAEPRIVRAKSVCSVSSRRVEQQVAEADHAVHRRADLVAHRREEFALGAIGGFGLVAGPVSCWPCASMRANASSSVYARSPSSSSGATRWSAR